ncbi:hypothetical protein IEQ34_022864 [Dendrobium chrysotoxum]|uniref:Uncharacterized protein n=1 Tax=Dendrobium chrysotoxum TaxID=161865 RepID=A0AAV7FYY2_DENCH|nr:hypothetical protein IEQ34_022864 [Dendrobium chrysotoxum]
MEDAKKRSKAMQCAVGMHGVLSVSHEGDKMTVVGEGIDSVALTRLLRKKMGYVELEVVTTVEEKKEEKKVKVEAEGIKSNIQPVILPYYHGQSVGAITQPPYYYVDPNCQATNRLLHFSLINLQQKVVLKLSMEDAKKRSKAMRCAVGMHGVLSVSHEGDKMTVVGEGIDSVALTRLLRKKMGYVELEVVTTVDEKKEEKEVKVEAEGKSNIQPMIFPYYQPPYYYVREANYDQNNCSILSKGCLTGSRSREWTGSERGVWDKGRLRALV